MKLPILLLLPLTVALASAAPRTSANYTITSETTDAGGRRAASANYTNAGSAGLLAGISTIAAPPGMAKHGYIGQLYDVSSLIVNSVAPEVNEAGTLQLAAWQLLDDATFLAVDVGSVAWGIVSGPITEISATGLATAGLVFENTPATVDGIFGGFTGSLNLTVLDTIPDNFGAYAGDGLADDWQVQYFGLDNPDAAPGLDPDGDGGTNLFEFTAGLLPTDPASAFRLHLEAVPGEPSWKNVIFSPRLDDRTYMVEARAGLDGGEWVPLNLIAESDDGEERTVTDLDAEGAKFYRVEITKP